jgi:hypothetical protein
MRRNTAARTAMQQPFTMSTGATAGGSLAASGTGSRSKKPG